MPNTHFSMLNQMILRILAPLETHGYILPDKMIPDIALGKMFSKWLRDSGYNPDKFPYYEGFSIPVGIVRVIVTFAFMGMFSNSK